MGEYIQKYIEIIVSMLQKKALRLVAKVDYLSATKPIFHAFNTLNIYDLIDLNTAIVMYKAFKNVLPTNLQKYFILTGNVHSYNTRQCNHFHTHSRKTTLKSMCLSNRGVTLWNSLSSNVKLSRSCFMFEKILKFDLLQAYLGE